MSDDDKAVFVASKETADKIKKLQEQLNLDSPGKVIAMGLSLIELSLGREIEFIEGDKKLRVSKFSKFNPTVVLDDNGSSEH